MFLIRNVEKKDYKHLLALAREFNTVNLPSHPTDIRKMIERSLQSFAGQYTKHSGRAQFLFVMENLRTGRVIGTSKIFSRHGTPRKPHIYFQVMYESVRSKTLGTRFNRKFYRLKTDTHGYTEIGGLVLRPRYRGHPDQLGKQLSLVRFLYMRAHPTAFMSRVIAELLPPLNRRGESNLWNFYGYPLTHIPYHEADQMSYHNKEFILKLFPHTDLYHDILPADVQAIMEQTGPGSSAARHLLTRIGFRYAEQVDPFDGGPYYIAERNKISVYRQTRKYLCGGTRPSFDGPLKLILTESNGKARILLTQAKIINKKLYLPSEAERALGPLEGQAMHTYNW